MALVDTAPMYFLLLVLFITLLSGSGSKPKKHKSAKRTLRCIYVVWGVGSNLEYHIHLKGRISFLILSCLSAFTTCVDAHNEQSLKDLNVVLDNMITPSDASEAFLYAPFPNVNKCTNKTMFCFLLELFVILQEENSHMDNLNVIYTLSKEYASSTKCRTCLACEAHPLVNFTTFYKRMRTFIQKLNSVRSSSEFKDHCD